VRPLDGDGRTLVRGARYSGRQRVLRRLALGVVKSLEVEDASPVSAALAELERWSARLVEREAARAEARCARYRAAGGSDTPVGRARDGRAGRASDTGTPSRADAARRLRRGRRAAARVQAGPQRRRPGGPAPRRPGARGGSQGRRAAPAGGTFQQDLQGDGTKGDQRANSNVGSMRCQMEVRAALQHADAMRRTPVSLLAHAPQLHRASPGRVVHPTFRSEW